MPNLYVLVVFIQAIQTEAFEETVLKYAKDWVNLKELIKKVLDKIGLLGFAKKLLGKC